MAIVVCVVLATGCANRTVSYAALGVGATSLSFGSVMLLVGGSTVPSDNCYSDRCDDRNELQRDGAILSMSGLALLVVGLVGVLGDDPKPHAPPRPPRDPETEARAEARQRAWDLTKEAAAAARAGDCNAVLVATLRVQAIDAEFHATVFVRDVAIAQCLQAANGSGATVPP
jgi:hypothetical protein